MIRGFRWGLGGLLLALIECTAILDRPRTDMTRATSPQVGIDQPGQESAQRHIDRGVYFLLQGYLDAAARELREATRLAPDNPAAHNNLGMVLHAQGRYADALSELRAAVELAPESAPTRSNLGFALFERGDVGSAMEQWETALQLNGHLAGAWAGLALGLFAFGYREEAIQSYTVALRLDPQYGDVGYLQRRRHWGPGAIGQAAAVLRLIKPLRPSPPRKILI